MNIDLQTQLREKDAEIERLKAENASLSRWATNESVESANEFNSHHEEMLKRLDEKDAEIERLANIIDLGLEPERKRLADDYLKMYHGSISSIRDSLVACDLLDSEKPKLSTGEELSLGFEVAQAVVPKAVQLKEDVERLRALLKQQYDMEMDSLARENDSLKQTLAAHEAAMLKMGELLDDATSYTSSPARSMSMTEEIERALYSQPNVEFLEAWLMERIGGPVAFGKEVVTTNGVNLGWLVTTRNASDLTPLYTFKKISNDLRD